MKDIGKGLLYWGIWSPIANENAGSGSVKWRNFTRDSFENRCFFNVLIFKISFEVCSLSYNLFRYSNFQVFSSKKQPIKCFKIILINANFVFLFLSSAIFSSCFSYMKKRKRTEFKTYFIWGGWKIDRPCISIVTFTMCQDNFSHESSDSFGINYHAKMY